MNKLIWVAVVLVLLVGGIYFYSSKEEKYEYEVDAQNATYTIEAKPVILINGELSTEILPGSASRNITKIFGQPVIGDANGDGKNDAVVILTHSTGGTGTFYYVSVALNEGSNTKGTNAVFLGDRIALKNVALSGGQIMVTFAERNISGTSAPVEVTKYFKLQNGLLTEVK